MTPRTLIEVFLKIAEHDLARALLVRGTTEWTAISSAEFRRRTLAVCESLRSWGINKGNRVAILSENRPEWAIADFAILLIGSVTVPIYSTLTPEQVLYVLRDSGARAIFVSTEAQLRKVEEIRAQSGLEKVIVMDEVCCDGSITMGSIFVREMESEPKLQQVGPEDLATLIYTSGTTGIPKGVRLTHGNMASNLISLQQFNVQPAATSVSFLPLSHITARHVDLALLQNGVSIAYVPFVQDLPRALLEIRPRIFVAVPRVYEKVHAEVEHKAKYFPAQRIYRWAMAVGKKHRSEILAGKMPASREWRVADRLVFRKIRAGLGGKVEIFISGGAPLGHELAEWYADAGIRIHEGYGLTETSPVIAVNTPGAHKLGTVGKPLPNVEVRIADDGEILVRGPSVFKGYWQKPEETREAFIDGWFKTGDVGNIDKDGFLSVTDRKKDLIKTSGGKFIAPQPIENSLKHNPLVAECAIIGEKRKFPSVLIAPQFARLEEWAQEKGIGFSSRAELVAEPEVRALYESIVEDVNEKLARFEKLKRTLLVPDVFTPENGTLTASLKMRRRAIEERYQKMINAMYEEAERTGPPAEVSK
jgi:long-chain acyl-CoA synthetase